MGIRYYAYAFDDDMTERAFADPLCILSDDPLADAWGLVPGAAESPVTGQPRVPPRDMLYLDKAWPLLQSLTAPDGAARPAHRMFEGEVRMHAEGWDPWIRTLSPEEIPAIARDLAGIDESQVSACVDRIAPGLRRAGDLEYAREYLRRAQRFVTDLAAEHRGMVYQIG
ncbi:YfbM family protein [Ruania suaedae]|uniref:DUF1877 family protein n=1 Tax=Ruania suaedae TaxID=2897774 RepID=UPI001E44CB8C|nr:DUF1877 family protein [Ruania suaedae]UFU02300.1 YfbM family protein [Ruania suaedae]